MACYTLCHIDLFSVLCIGLLIENEFWNSLTLNEIAFFIPLGEKSHIGDHIFHGLAVVFEGLSIHTSLEATVDPVFNCGVTCRSFSILGKAGYNSNPWSMVGYGCTTCIGNSGPLNAPIQEAIDKGNLSVAAVLSGNRNFEGRVHPW